MRLLIKQQEIENAQTQICKSLSQYCTQGISVSLGFQGGHVNCTINWSPNFGLWFYSEKLDSRYWNAFGLSDNAPKNNSMLPIVVEINPPLKDLNRRVQGAFMTNDKGEIILVHRGKIGGGKPGIGRKLFFDNYQNKTKDINGKQFAIIGNINSPRFIREVKAFVQEVARIKAIAP